MVQHLSGNGSRSGPHAADAPAADATHHEGNAGRSLADALGVPFVENLAGRACSPDFTARVPIAFAREHSVIGLRGENAALTVAFADMSAWDQLDVLGRYLRVAVEPVVAPAPTVVAAINEAYQQRSGEADAVIAEIDPGEVLAQVRELAAKEDLLDAGGRAPVIKLVNLFLFEAVKASASDVHVQPYEERLVVRVRVDGILYDQ